MVAAVVLAAGASTRFGSPKQRLLVPLVLERVRNASSVGDVVVVLGAHDLETDARVVRCAEWERGPGASLRCGLAALPEDADAAVVVLADGPDLSPAAVDRVVEVWHRDGGDVLAASYGGVRGHPVLLARAAWARMPDEGARALEPRLIACDDLGAPGDVDRLIDLSGRGGGEWAAEAVVDEALARRLIAAQFPEVELDSLRLLGEGWDNTVWLAGERWVFRFPRRLIAVPAVERQLAVLPNLAPLLPLPISAPVFAGLPAEGYAWPFLGCPHLPGREAADLAPDDGMRTRAAIPLARFLRALHDPANLDRVLAARALPLDPVTRADMRMRVPRTRERFAELERLGVWRPTRDAVAILDAAAELEPSTATAVCHGDLHGRHLLLGEDGTPTAVIDWDDLCLADPAIDLLLVWSFLPPAARDAFFEEYGAVSEPTQLRARVLALFLAGTLAVYAHREGRAALERDSLAGLKRASQPELERPRTAARQNAEPHDLASIDAHHARLVESGTSRPEWRITDGAARLILWGAPGADTPAAVEVLAASGETVARALLAEAGRRFGPRSLLMTLDDPAPFGMDASALRSIADALGSTVVRETDRWERCRSDVAASRRLTWSEPEDDAFYELMGRTLAGTADRALRSVAAGVSPSEAARRAMRGIRRPPRLWEVGYDERGYPVGVSAPATTGGGHAVIAYVGVLPEQRRRGYANDLLARATHRALDAGASSVRGDTDVGNSAMAAAFRRLGYVRFASRVELELRLT